MSSARARAARYIVRMGDLWGQLTTCGAQATLVAWLKRQAEAHFGERVVGQQVWVCWVSDGQYYRATILSYSRNNGKHKVRKGCWNTSIINATCARVGAIP